MNVERVKYDARVFQIVENHVKLGGKPIDFHDYAPFKEIYQSYGHKLITLAGRQVGKTVQLAAKIAARSALSPNNQGLYVSPLESQAKTFSKTKLKPIISGSPFFRELFLGKGADDAVFFKRTKFGSYIELSYASTKDGDPGRIRGKSADDLYLDEIQDIDLDALAVIEEVTTASYDPQITYAGTAKGTDNTAGVLWDRSSKMEFIVPCGSCGKWNILGVSNISKKGLVCSKTTCRKPLYVQQGSWSPTNAEGKIIGFRIPQICLPFHNRPRKWAAIWEKYTEYSEEKFSQEVLGLPTGKGSRVITIEELKALCTAPRMREYPAPEQKKYLSFYLGIDWSGNGLLQKSRTAVVVLGLKRNGDIDLVYGKIYPQIDYTEVVADIIKIGHLWSVSMIGADAGMGAMQNAELAKEFGSNRFWAFQYMASRVPYKPNGEARICDLNKKMAIDSVMMMFKNKFMYKRSGGVSRPLLFNFPPEEESFHFFQDILAEFTEETQAGNMRWTHNPMVPDDTLHAIVFGIYGMMLQKGNVKFL